MSKSTIALRFLLVSIVLFIINVSVQAKPQKRSGTLAGFKADKSQTFSLSCKREQPPFSRTPNKGHKIVFESTTIIKTTKISISGEVEFNLACTHDAEGDDAKTPRDETSTEDSAEKRNSGEENVGEEGGNGGRNGEENDRVNEGGDDTARGSKAVKRKRKEVPNKTRFVAKRNSEKPVEK